ncbi:ChaB family protein [Rhodopseudomonas pseudopalustris]|uniref:Cation transport regulator n=1 Tax=Rhodopseudomonas pseudopalustris TaxID=1513892 RepID=A0A1H8XGP0_9BRAD|nr:ChaB family protein [Rhodopseudomonas pseudopalustris]SEP38428.1 cation transport regulator [Rhodopseudomonas pseudopalustris]
MPYSSIDDLPPSLQVRLPLHAQSIYLAAFNNAFADNADRGPEEQESSAHRVAWAAVKKQYRKQDERWVARDPLRSAGS